MKRIFLLQSVFLVAALPAVTQPVSISSVNETAANAEREYTIFTGQDEAASIRKYPGTIEFVSAGRTFANYEQIAVSPGTNLFGFLVLEDGEYRADIVQEDGEIANRVEELGTYDADDPSPKVYVLDNGEFFFRYNISFFHHYDSDGTRLESINNSSDSPHGEIISELEIMPRSNAVLLYNPRILYNEDIIGSRLRYYDGSGEPETIFSSDRRYIENISFSDNGQLIVLHLIEEASGAHSAVAIDADGNELFTNDYDGFEPVEHQISRDSRYLTSRGSGRVMVHDMLRGESLGATSLGQSTLAATYAPEYNSMLILTGSLRASNRQLTGLELRIVDVVARSIDTEEIEGQYSWDELLDLTFEPRGRGLYRIYGINRQLEVRFH